MEQDAVKYMGGQENTAVFDKWVVVGHCPTLNYSHKRLSCNPLINHNRNFVIIDGALDTWHAGQLNALIICDGMFSYQSDDNLPRHHVTKGQQASGGDLGIVWTGEAEVELVTKGEEFSFYRHVETGKIIQLANRTIDIMENGALRCSLDTDYFLPANAGDEIRVVFTYSDRIFAKMDGIIGYYRISHE